MNATIRSLKLLNAQNIEQNCIPRSTLDGWFLEIEVDNAAERQVFNVNVSVGGTTSDTPGAAFDQQIGQAIAKVNAEHQVIKANLSGMLSRPGIDVELIVEDSQTEQELKKGNVSHLRLESSSLQTRGGCVHPPTASILDLDHERSLIRPSSGMCH